MSNVQLELDKSGFPIILTVPGMWMHVLPVTKIQFETYLYYAMPEKFDAARYLRATSSTAGNPRVGPDKITRQSEFGVYMTSLSRSEVVAFCDWMNGIRDPNESRSWQIPTVRQWRDLYDYCTRTDFGDGLLKEVLACGLTPQVQTLFTNLNKYCGRLSGNGLDALAIRNGVLEYVDGGLMGTPCPASGRSGKIVERPIVDRGDFPEKSDGFRLVFK